ncbi:IPT/TIG domain-containing protein [Chitinophaga lutea]
MKLRYLLIALLSFAFVSCDKDDDKRVDTVKINTVYPSSGTPSVIVTINGRSFSGVREENKVTFNGVEAVVLEANATKLLVVSPATGTTGQVVVTVKGQEAKGPVFTYVAPPEEYTVSTFAGNATAGSVDGAPADVLLRSPEGVTMDNAGNIIITDRGNNRIRRALPNGSVSAIAGNDVAGYAEGAAARFRLPWKSAVDAQGNIYVADRDNHRIRKITPAGITSTVAGNGTAGFADGPATMAMFNQPLDVTVDAAGNIYVADNLNHRIRKIGTDGMVTTVAGNGTAGFVEGTGTAAQLKNPSGLDLDKDGNLIVADRLNHRIRKITPAGVVSSIAGDGTTGFRDGAAVGARFADPYSIAIDKNGNIIIADLTNNKVRKLNAAGVVSTVAGTSKGLLDGAGVVAQFNQPTDVCTDAAGNIYVADLGNNCVRKIILMK